MGAGVLLTGRGAVAAESGQRHLTIGVTQYAASLNPLIDAMLAKSFVLGLVRRPFTAYDADWKLVCMLCEELPTFDNGGAELLPPAADSASVPGVRLTYRIAGEAVWGDGEPLTAADVRFSWEVGRHPESGVSNLELYRRIIDIEIVDDQTFAVVFDRSTFQYNAINDLLPLPEHLERAVFEADPAQYKYRTLYQTDPTNPGLYFGPYRVADVVSGAHIRLERNPLWWGRMPVFDGITIRTIENSSALEANILAGALDMVPGTLGLTIDQALAFEQRHGDRFKVLFKPGLYYEHIDLNLDNPILADVRVRQALLHGLDRQTLSRQLFAGQQPVARSFISPLDSVHGDALPVYPYDPERAAALLDEAGYSDKRGGIRYHKESGDRLSLVLMTTAGDRTRELVAQVLQSQWKQAGIEVKLQHQPARVLFGETLTQRKFPGMVMFSWLSHPEHVPRTVLHSSHVPRPGNNFGGQNYTGLQDDAIDTLIDAIEVELDREKRLRMWHRLQSRYKEVLPVLPLYFRAAAYVLPPWLEGVTPTGHLGPVTLWVEDWRVVP